MGTLKWVLANWQKLAIIILATLLFIMIKSCKGGNAGSFKNDTLSKVVIKYIPIHDTSYIDSPVIIKTIPIEEIPANYMPTSTYDSLKVQYVILRNDFLAKNVYDRKFKVDSFGYVELQDSVFENKLLKSTFIDSLKFPKITITNIITNTTLEGPSTQLYFGLGILGNKTDILSGISGNLLLKTKKDKIYSLGAIYNSNQLYYQFSTYWKIHI